MVGRSARVHGYVANASIERDLEGKRVRLLGPEHTASRRWTDR